MSKIINGKLISDELVEEYEKTLNEYNRLYDIVEGANDYGDNIVNGDYESKNELNDIEKKMSEIENESIINSKIVVIDERIILESDLENYKNLKADYNYYYDLSNGAMDMGDNVVNGDFNYNDKIDELEKEINALEAKATLAIKTETIDGREILLSDLKEYKEVKKKYDELYDLSNGAMDMGDNIVNGEMSEENQKELDELYEKLESFENRAKLATSKLNNKNTKSDIDENNNNENNSNNNADDNKNENNTGNNDNENNNDNSDNNNDDNNNDNKENDDLRKKTEEAIEKIKETLDPKAPKEELDNIIEKMNSLIMILFNYEQSLFESKLKEKNTVEEKMDLIEKRQNELDGYGKFYESENPEISNLLLSSKEKMLNYIKTSYTTSKSSGEYTWTNYESIKESKEYIEANINKDADFKFQFDTLLSKMEDIIKNPEQEQYENWKINMNEFTNKLGLNSSEIIPYMNARAKLINPNLDIDKEYNINGLGLNVGTKGVDPVPTPTPTPTPIPDPTPEPSIPTSTEKPPIKQRLKVVAKKALNWMKEHKLITIGLGLALTTVLLFSIPATHMMINSCLWGVGKSLGWSTATLDSLHGINLGLAKGVAGGKYLFESASGAYTLAGAAGAKALYSAGAANLVGAVTGLTAAGGAIGVGGALVKMGAAVKEKIKNALSKKKDEEEYEEDFFPENEEQVELEKEKNKTNELTEIKEQIIALQQQSREMQEAKKEIQEQLESERKKSDQLLDTNLKLINLLKSRGLSDEEIKESLNNNSDELENEKTQVIK